MRLRVWSPALLTCSLGYGSSVAVSCGVGHRCGSDPACHRPAAVALIRPLAWEPPYIAGAALKSKTKIQTGIQKWDTMFPRLQKSGRLHRGGDSRSAGPRRPGGFMESELEGSGRFMWPFFGGFFFFFFFFLLFRAAPLAHGGSQARG